MPPRAKAAVRRVRSTRLIPSPPSPIASPGAASAGIASAPPPPRRRAANRAGPIADRSSIAGTFSESCSARRAVTVPWNVRSKFSGP